MERVTVCIPSIPPRRTFLARAIQSVTNQSHPVAHMSIAVDLDREGAWATRNRALARIDALSMWVAFLDDDDEMLGHHIEKCLEVARITDADVIVPWYDVIGGTDPVPGHRSLPIDGRNLHSFGITCLVRAEVATDVKFRPREETGVPEDWDYWVRLGRAGAKFVKIPETTWLWHHHGRNTSGQPWTW